MPVTFKDISTGHTSIASDVAAVPRRDFFKLAMPITPLTLNSTAADKQLVSAVTPTGLREIVDANIEKVWLVLALTLQNQFAGLNKVNGAQSLQLQVDGGGYTTVATIPDDSLRMEVQGASAPLVLKLDVTSIVTNIDGSYDVKWVNADLDQDSAQLEGSVGVEYEYEA